MKQRKKTLEEARKLPRHSLVLILENIRSAYNVGALFRTADGVLLEKIILVGTTPLPPSTHIDKAALGATDAVPWEHYTETSVIIKKLRYEGYTIIALEQTDSSVTYFSAPYTFSPPYTESAPRRYALVVGNEVDGVAQTTLQISDYSVDIPMFGRASSLNVATAAGIVLYDIVKYLIRGEKAQNLT